MINVVICVFSGHVSTDPAASPVRDAAKAPDPTMNTRASPSSRFVITCGVQ
jgi:hypothetical protein